MTSKWLGSESGRGNESVSAFLGLIIREKKESEKEKKTITQKKEIV